MIGRILRTLNPLKFPHTGNELQDYTPPGCAFPSKYGCVDNHTDFIPKLPSKAENYYYSQGIIEGCFWGLPMIDGGVYSCQGQKTYPKKEVARAECIGTYTLLQRHISPDEQCSCGFYFYYAPWLAQCRNSLPKDYVSWRLYKAKFYGRIVLHRFGGRAEYREILEEITGYVDPTAYVSPQAYIGPYARILENARIEDSASVVDSAEVKEQALIKDNACIAGTSIVGGTALIKDYAYIKGSSRISGCVIIGGSALINEYSTITTASLASKDQKEQTEPLPPP